MLLFQNDLITQEAFFNFLQSRKGLLDGVVICWGEPTIQSDLYDFAKKIKEMWFLVKLDTNGRDYLIIKRMIQDEILDYVAVDLKHSMDHYDETVGLSLASDFFINYGSLLRLLLESDIDYEYRTTVVKWLHTAESIESMAKYIHWAKAYYLQNYVGGNTLDPDFGWVPFNDDELMEFQKIATPYVQRCEVRK